jgi:hypothetical protein
MKYIYFTHWVVQGFSLIHLLLLLLFLSSSSSILSSKLMFVLMMGFVTRFNGSGFRCAWQVERRIDLVYGGGSVGLMGLVSQAVHDGGRHVLGFVPLSLSLSLSLWS